MRLLARVTYHALEQSTHSCEKLRESTSSTLRKGTEHIGRTTRACLYLTHIPGFRAAPSCSTPIPAPELSPHSACKTVRAFLSQAYHRKRRRSKARRETISMPMTPQGNYCWRCICYRLHRNIHYANEPCTSSKFNKNACGRRVNSCARGQAILLELKFILSKRRRGHHPRERRPYIHLPHFNTGCLHHILEDNFFFHDQRYRT